MTLEDRIWPLLVGGDNKSVTKRLEIFPQPQLTRHAAEQRSWLKVDRLRSRQRLPARITFDRRQIVARVGLRISVDRIIVENTKNLSHINPPLMSQSLKSIHWRSTIAHATRYVPGSGLLPTGEGRRNLLSRLRHSGRSRVVPSRIIYKYIDANKTNLCGGSRGLNDGRRRHLFGP